MIVKPKVLFTDSVPDEWIISIVDQVEIIIADPTDMFRDINEVDGIFSLHSVPIGSETLLRASRLKVISNMAVGYDNIDVKWCTENRIPVGNTPDAVTESTAEAAFGLIIAVSRNFHQASEDARKGEWKGWSLTGWLGTELSGKTLGILGMGKIGNAVARRALGFDMRIIYHNRQPVRNFSEAEFVSFEELLQRSDILSLHCPLNDQTRGIIDQKALQQMKSSAILINTSRGKVVDQAALFEALKNGTITSAGLDVTDPEPLPVESNLFDLKNCYILPHIGTSTHEARKKMARLACENLMAGLKGRQLPNCVNPEIYKQ